MRPTTLSLALAALAVGAFTASVLTGQPVFLVLGTLSGSLLIVSRAGDRRPFMQALLALQDQPVQVLVWGVSPPSPPGPDGPLVVSAVYTLGAGVHVLLRVPESRSIHLKVAQPADATFTSHTVVIGSAKYVQWQGKTLPRLGTGPALSVSLKGSGPAQRGGVV